MPSKDGWTLEREHQSVKLGAKTYRNMEEWSRPCAVCGDKFFIFTRIGAQSINSSFGLKTCSRHRGQASLAAYGAEAGEVERLRGQVETMKAELDPIYQRNRELFAENQVLKARLSKYELSSETFAQVNNGENLTNNIWKV